MKSVVYYNAQVPETEDASCDTVRVEGAFVDWTFRRAVPSAPRVDVVEPPADSPVRRKRTGMQ